MKTCFLLEKRFKKYHVNGKKGLSEQNICQAHVAPNQLQAFVEFTTKLCSPTLLYSFFINELAQLLTIPSGVNY